MATLLTTFDPTNPTSGNFVATFNSGKGTLHIKNASPVDVGFSLDQSGYVQYVVQAGEPRDIPVPKPRMTVNWSQQNKLNTNSKQIQSVVYVESYECGETIPASQALPRHQNTTNIGFSGSLNTIGGVTFTAVISLFNPANSPVNLIVVSIRGTTRDTGAGQFALLTLSADTTLGAIPPINNTLGGPASQASFQGASGVSAQGVTTIEIQRYTNPTQYVFDLLPFPMQMLIPPGQGLAFNGQLSASVAVSLIMRWTENPI